MTFRATMPGFITTEVNATISVTGETHFIGISLSPNLEAGKPTLRFVMNWGAKPTDLDLHALQIDK